MTRIVLLVVALGAVAAVGAGALAALGGRSTEPVPATFRGPDVATLDAAIARGVAHLVSTQNESGSWGKAAGNLWDIYAPIPGSYYAFEVAATALAVCGLREAAPDDPAGRAAADRGLEFLLREHTKARRITPDVLYNVWAHAYALEAFADEMGRVNDPERLAALRRGAEQAIDFLARFEFVDGGWGYYNFGFKVQRPATGSTSFTTATVLLALRKAADRGVKVPSRLVPRALHLLDVSRKPDDAFAYSWDHRYWPQGGINKTQGSLARTPVCLGAIRRWGGKVTERSLVKALDDLDEKGHFLLIARKYPIPHESWFQNSGYFCFYGYRYAADLFDLVPKDVARHHARRIAATLLPLQEPDGSWWDYQLYSYHKPYGTGYVLEILAACRRYR